MNNGEFLRNLAERHGLSVEDLSRLARVSVHTAQSWLRPKGNAAHREPPDGLVELICIKLGEPSPFK